MGYRTGGIRDAVEALKQGKTVTGNGLSDLEKLDDGNNSLVRIYKP